MAPYDFKALDADVILRSSDEKEFPVHSVMLSFSSPVFKGMFGLPQPTESSSQIPTIDVSESSDILKPFIQYLYPRSSPNISDIAIWAAVYAAADKYQAEGVMDSLRDILPKFIEASPLRVYALASRWGFEEEAKTASTRTLTLDILKEFTPEDAEMMGGPACHKLFLSHFNRREAVRAFIMKHPRPLPSNITCACPTPLTLFVNFIPDLCQRVGAKPSTTLEEVYEVATDYGLWPAPCDVGCRYSHENKHEYYNSLARGISALPSPTE